MRKKTNTVFFIGTSTDSESQINIYGQHLEVNPIAFGEIRQIFLDEPVDADIFGYTAMANPSKDSICILLDKSMPWFPVEKEVSNLHMESVLNFIKTPHKYNYFRPYSKKPLKEPNDFQEQIKKMFFSFPFEESATCIEELVDLGKNIIKFLRFPGNSELSNPWFVFLVNKTLPLLENSGYYGIHSAITFVAKNVFRIQEINSVMLPIVLNLEDKYIYNILDETNIFAIEAILTSTLDTAKDTLSSVFILLIWGYNSAHHARFMEYAESASIFTRRAGMKEAWPIAIERVCKTKWVDEDEVTDFFRFIRYFDVENLSTNVLDTMKCPNVITRVCFNKVFIQEK